MTRNRPGRRVLSACCLLAALVPAGLAAPPLDVQALLSGGHAPEAGECVRVAELDVEIGHLELVMIEGEALPLSVAGRRVGIFFRGQARFEYASTDADEWAVMETSVDSETSYELEEGKKSRRLGGVLEEFLLWGSPDMLPELPGEPRGGLAAALEDHLGYFGRLSSYGGLNFPVTHFLVKQILDRPDLPYARIEMVGEKGDLVYEYDPVETRSERLAAFREIPFTLPEKSLTPILLSEQPIERSRRAFNHPNYVLTNVRYELTATKEEDASLSLLETIRPQMRAQRVFLFNLNSHVFDTKARRRDYVVKSVRDNQGNDLVHHHAKDRLAVVLPAKAAPNAYVRLAFEIHGQVLYKPNNDSFWMLPVGPWFPQPDLGGQYYKVQSTVRVEKPFVPIAPGKTIERGEEGEFNVVKNRIDKPVQFIYVVAGKYHFKEETKDGLTVRVATYAMENERAMDTHLNLSRKLVEFYEPWLGPFPFEEFNVIEINSLGWGQAPPATMFITREAFAPWFDQIWSKGVNHRVAHEVAHQYWGHVVKMGSDEEQWITEAFAEYCASFAIRQLKGDDDRDELVEQWYYYGKESTKKATIPLANRLAAQRSKSFLDRRNLLYFKGAYVLEALRDEIGHKEFLAFLRHYQQGLAWRFATTEQMLQLLKQITGDDHEDFFEKYYWGTKMPSAKLIEN